MKIRIGHGLDIHQLIPGKPLTLGGVNIKSKLGILGHSDGDVVIHALVDAEINVKTHQSFTHAVHESLLL